MQTLYTSDISSVPTSWPRSPRQRRYVDLYDLYDLARVAGWEPYYLHDPGHVSWVGSVLNRSCTTYHNGRLGSRLSTVDRDLDRDPSARGV